MEYVRKLNMNTLIVTILGGISILIGVIVLILLIILIRKKNKV